MIRTSGPALRVLAAAFALLGLLALPAAVGQAPTPGVLNEVWLVPIEGEITAATTAFVRSRVVRANDERPLALAFYVDTPGGSVEAMRDIVTAIMQEAQVPTLAVVQNAFSAGALIAMSAERLAMLPGSSIGAALPILATPTGIAPVDEKFTSALRGEFRSVAEARGRNATVAEGMVDERVVIPGLSTASELVTLTARQAVEHGIADVQANTLAEALTSFGYGGVPVERLEPTFGERLGAFLSQPLLAAVLLVVGIGGLLIEIFSPGFGVPGAIGVVALAAFAYSAFVATPAGPVDLLLLVVGVVLLALEVLVLPGFGIAGILGLVAMVFAVVRIFEESSLSVIGYSALMGGVLLAVLLWMLPNSRLAAAFRLSTRLATPSGPTFIAEDVPDLVGAVGTALSDLRPAGVARFGSARVDVVSEGDYVPAGSRLKVLRVEGNRVTVRAVDGDPATAADTTPPTGGAPEARADDAGSAAQGREES
ncbi:MAG TPA: NfeD family protein [Trueperaceae bacterium]|nr:NfeD family protein [Trueperaceae bacterium]